MSLPQEPVFSKLQNEFVIGWRNIIDQEYVGESAGYTCDQPSVGTTNGAGPHNIQLFVLSSDLTVMHALTGFWHPEDLAKELGLAKQLLAVWNDKNLSRTAKNTKFKQMQLAEFQHASKATVARSGWQGFDASNEMKRVKSGKKRDTLITYEIRDRRGKVTKRTKMKPVNQLVHERMAARPFVKFADFDVAEFADYGRVYYDNNRRHGKGAILMTPRKVAKKKAKEDKIRKARERAEARRAEARRKSAERKRQWDAKREKQRKKQREARQKQLEAKRRAASKRKKIN